MRSHKIVIIVFNVHRYNHITNYKAIVPNSNQLNGFSLEISMSKKRYYGREITNRYCNSHLYL